jgi:hypothetical protein
MSINISISLMLMFYLLCLGQGVEICPCYSGRLKPLRHLYSAILVNRVHSILSLQEQIPIKLLLILLHLAQRFDTFSHFSTPVGLEHNICC